MENNKPNTGSIFKNDYRTDDKHPHYKGTIDVDGVKKEIALWMRESSGGVKYFSVAISEPFVKKENEGIIVTEEEALPF
jgi:uncharacterized protein (DUF736 family)